MARRKKPAPNAELTDKGTAPSPMEKIASLLALIATRGMETDEASIKLDSIGFGAREISAILNVSANYVNVAKHRKKTGSRKSQKSA